MNCPNCGIPLVFIDYIRCEFCFQKFCQTCFSEHFCEVEEDVEDEFDEVDLEF